MPGPVILALDIGSTSAKAQRFDARGLPLGVPVRGRVAIAPDGTADPDAFCASVEAVVDEVLEPSRPALAPDAAPDAVALTCAWHGLVGLDAGGRPTTPLTTWQHTQAAGAAAELRRRLADPEAVRRRTGAPVHPSLPAARLLWWSGHDPAAFAATHRWCSTGEFLEARWLATSCGPSASMASGTGCFDQEAQRWDAEVLDAAGIAPGSLTPVDDRPRKGLAVPYRERWPALEGIPWLPALGDGACSALGSAGGGGRRAALTVGTTAAVRVLGTPAERAARPPALFAYLLDPTRVVLGAARSNAGNLAEWAAGALRLDGGPGAVVEAVAARRPGAHGLVAVPALAGERSPDWPVDASGALAGLRHSTTALDLAQALLEAAVLGLAGVVDVLEAVAGPLVLVGSGGAFAGSPAWPRLLADAIGRPIVTSAVPEASARGAALFALDRLGWMEPGAGTIDGETVVPDPVRHAAFARLREKK